MDLQSSRYRTDVQNKPIQTKDLIPVVNDLEKLSEAMSNNIVEAPFTPNDNPIVADDTYQEAFEKAQGQINGIGTEITTINGEIAQLQNNEYKITYYEVVSGAGGSLTVPTGATINEGEFGISGNCILSKINVDNKPTFESPKTAGGVIVTASLDPITGVWAASGVYTDPSVALIYSLKINALNYPNLDYDFIIQSEEIDDKTTFVAPLVKDVSKDEVSIPPATTTDDGYLTSTDWNTFNNKQPAGNYITALTGDVTASGAGSVPATIANDAVTNDKLANMATQTFKGRTTAGSGDPEDLTKAQAQGILGLPTSTTDNAIARFDSTGGNIQNSTVFVNDDGSITLTGVAAPTYAQGKLAYDTDNESLTFFNNDSNVGLQIGQEAWIRVRNDSGSSIANGSAVYISGTHASGIPQISLAQANAAATTIVAGLATETIANNAIGYVTSIGLVRGLNTSGFAAGATLFLSAATPGALTTTAPTSPNYRFRVGIVTRSNVSNGTIHVTPSTGAVGNGTAGQVLGINGSGNQAFLNASEIVGYQGYVITAKMGTSNTLNPADASTYYWGGPLTNAFQSTPAVRRLYFPKAGTIKAATLFSTQSGGSNEQSTISIRLNNTSDTSISTTATFATSVTLITNTALNIPVVVGDYIEIKWVTPTWVTNPTNMVIDSQIYIE